MLRYAVVGAGAVGGFYGIRLAGAGASVQFLVRGEVELLRAQGLTLISPQGGVHRDDVAVADDWAELEPCDVLLVSVKAISNAAVLTELAVHAERLLGRDGAVLLAQNGIGVEDAYAQVIGGRELLGGLAFLCAHRKAPGVIEHLDYGALTLAAHTPRGRPGGITPRMQQIAADLTAAGVPALLDDDLVRARWRKLMWNVPFNPLSVILDATTDQLLADPGSLALIRTLMTEVSALAAAQGHPLHEGLTDELLAMTGRMAPYATSMKLDADAGRRLEVDVMLGEPLRRAERLGVPTPAMAVLHQQLSFIDRRIAALDAEQQVVRSSAVQQPAGFITAQQPVGSITVQRPAGPSAWRGGASERSGGGDPAPGAGVRPKLLAVDVDGTLIDRNHRLGQRTIDAVRAAAGSANAPGIQVVLCTSRPPRAIAAILDALGLVGGRAGDGAGSTGAPGGPRDGAPFVASQGALVGRYRSEGELVVLHQQPMPVRSAQALVASLPDGVAVNWYARERWLVPAIDALVAEEARIVGFLPEVADLAAEQVGPDKLLILAPREATELLDGIDAPAGLDLVRSTPTHLEVTAEGVDKGGSLAALCHDLGFAAEEVAAIGDGWNDLTMLAFAGTAIAPANAVHAVRSQADFVVRSNDEDAVAHALQLLTAE